MRKQKFEAAARRLVHTPISRIRWSPHVGYLDRANAKPIALRGYQWNSVLDSHRTLQGIRSQLLPDLHFPRRVCLASNPTIVANG